MNQIIFGAAYYEELLPYDRLERDMELMKAAGINTVRTAEFSWSAAEPSPGIYDFSHVDRVIAAAARRGISVIVSTPTCAAPPWLVRMDPGVLVPAEDGVGRTVDITSPTYLHYAEGLLRALAEHTAGRGSVAGFQLDGGPRRRGAVGPAGLARFRRWMAERYGTVQAMNEALGLGWQSDGAASFGELPDPAKTASGGYACAFARFRRELAAEFLRWQADIISEYIQPDQFITRTLGLDWEDGALSGLLGERRSAAGPDADPWLSAGALTLAGAGVYCPGQDGLTGMEIAFAGDRTRPLGRGRYLALETQAQGTAEMAPYPGQLRLMAYSHLAAGAGGLMYWPWAPAHQGPDSAFLGVLGHDLTPGPAYEEVSVVGRELAGLKEALAGYEKKNRAALVVSQEAMTALDRLGDGPRYEDIVRWLYRALYELNIECDVLYDREEDWSGYDLLVLPALYTADYPLIGRVRDFVKAGGTVFASFRSFAADGHARLYHDELPHELTDLFGMRCVRAVRPEGVTAEGAPVGGWMELLEPGAAETAARYDHRHWGQYAAVTRSAFGAGRAWYVGAMLPPERLKDYLLRAAEDAGLELPPERFPVIVRQGVNGGGKTVRFLLNYSDRETGTACRAPAEDLLTGERFGAGDAVSLPPWGVRVLAED